MRDVCEMRELAWGSAGWPLYFFDWSVTVPPGGGLVLHGAYGYPERRTFVLSASPGGIPSFTSTPQYLPRYLIPTRDGVRGVSLAVDLIAFVAVAELLTIPLRIGWHKLARRTGA